MKYKKRIKALEGRQRWWENQSQAYQKATTKPGSIKNK